MVSTIAELFIVAISCTLLQILRLSIIRIASDLKRRSPTLFPVSPKLEVVFNGETVTDRTIYRIKVE